MRNSGQWSVVSGQSQSRNAMGLRCRCLQLTTGHRPLTTRNAFSLAELLVVISIIVLALALAVPALNLIQGTKSTEAAQNLAGLMIAQARNDAIGQQKYRGVFFYRDPATGRVNMCMVQESDTDTPRDGVDVYLDLVDGADTLMMPVGVSLQTVDDAGGNSLATRNDRYLGYNYVFFNGATQTGTSAGPLAIAYGGVILFDGHGQLANKAYAFQTRRTDAGVPVYTAMGVLMYATDSDAHLVRVGGGLQTATNKDTDVLPLDTSIAANASRIVKSQVGFVLFDEEVFKNNGGKDSDRQIDPALVVQADEDAEETWLDNNSVPILINRYNGSLVKGE